MDFWYCFRIGDGLESSGGGVPSLNCLINGEDEKNEEERGEELKKGSSLVAPWEQDILLQKRCKLLQEQGNSALQIHALLSFCLTLFEKRENGGSKSAGSYLLFLNVQGTMMEGKVKSDGLPLIIIVDYRCFTFRGNFHVVKEKNYP